MNSQNVENPVTSNSPSPSPPDAPPPAVYPPPPPRAPEAPRKGNFLVGFIVGLLILAAGGYGVYFIYTHYLQKSAGGDAKSRVVVRPTPVIVTKVRRGDFDLYVRGLGSVTAFNTVTVRSRVDGQLLKVAYNEGDLVHEGDLLAQIDDRPFQAMKEQAVGQQARDQASLDNAQADVDRYTKAGDAVAQQLLDTAVASVRNFKGVLAADKAAVDAAQLQVDYCRITAPITGRVGLRLVDQGNQVHASDPNGLIVITQLQPISVNFTIAEDNLPQVLNAMKADPKLALEAYSRDRSTKLATGTVLAVDNQIDPTTGTVRIKAKFDNEDSSLFPNQFVNVRLLVQIRKDVVLVDSAGVQRGPQGTFVYIAQKDPPATAPAGEPASRPDAEISQRPSGSAPATTQGRGGRVQEIYTVHMRPVTTSDEDGSRTIITAGLEQGDIVVTTGVDKLFDGSKVTIRYPDRASATQTATASMPVEIGTAPGRRGGRGNATAPATGDGSAAPRGDAP